MDLMIDLETLDTKGTAVILSVGVCAFNKDGIHDTKYFVLDAQEQVDAGRTVNVETIAWWMNGLSKEFVEMQKVADKYSTKKFLEKLSYFCSKNNIQKVWAQGMDFDLGMIGHLYSTNDVQLPWHFWNGRDTRTFYESMSGKKPERQGTHHNAMDDAVYQAECVIVGLKERK